jgi:hypothetical protein
MRKHQRIIFIGLALFFGIQADGLAQQVASMQQKVLDERNQGIADVTIELVRSKDSSFVMARLTDTAGKALFTNLIPGAYFIRMSKVGFLAQTSKTIELPVDNNLQLPDVQLQPANGNLVGITVTARKPFIEIKPGKTVVNMEAGFSSAGTTAMEALEKLPGITIDKDGNVQLKGRSGVTIMVDGKPSYLDGAQLSTLLGGMSASQISQVEIMDIPPSSFDAAGNAGVINIKTKKSNQKGFNTSLTSAYTQGRYAKYNENVQLNYRSGRWNTFLNYSLNNNRSFTRIDATRRYYK